MEGETASLARMPFRWSIARITRENLLVYEVKSSLIFQQKFTCQKSHVQGADELFLTGTLFVNCKGLHVTLAVMPQPESRRTA